MPKTRASTAKIREARSHMLIKKTQFMCTPTLGTHFAHAAVTEEENEHHRTVKDETFDCRGVADYVIMSTRKRVAAIQANFVSIQTSE